MADAIVAQARAEYPNEACGIVIGSGVVAEGGEALRYVACRNEAASPYRYVIDSQEALRLSIEADDAGQEFWAIVHSHVRSPAVPSPTDLGLAFWPDALYILVSLAEDQAGPGRRAVAPGVADPGRRPVRGRPGGRLMSAPPASPAVARGRVAWLLAGALALVGGTLLGWNSAFLEALATPPALIRAALVAAAVVAGLWLLARALRLLGASRGRGRER